MTDQAPAESPPPIAPTSPVRYATFTRRFRALVIDMLCVWSLVIVLLFLGDAVRSIPGATHLTWLLMLAVFLLYDPLQVSRRGATIGHAAARLRVVDARTGRWPSFALAFARSLVKSILGLISFFTMELTRRHQAVHDMLTHTTVQVAESAEDVEFTLERVDEPDVVLPSRLRRLTVILVYLLAIFVAANAAVVLVATPGCLRDTSCSPAIRVLIQVMGLAWLALSATTVIVGWKGLLFGARRWPSVQRA